MRRASIVSLAAALSACGNPRVEVSLEVPSSLEPMVGSISLVTIVPPAKQPFTCDHLAYQRVAPDVLLASEAGRLVVRGDRATAPIRDIDRLTRRLFRADVEDKDGNMIANACGELGEFAKDVTIRLVAEPAAHIVGASTSELGVVLGASPAPHVSFRVLDALNAPIPNAQVSWELASSGLLATTSTAVAGADGAIDLGPSYPRRAGPFVIDLRARWAKGPTYVSGFVAPAPKMSMVRGTPVGAVVGRVAPDGRPAVAVLISRPGQQSTVVETYDGRSFTTARELEPLRTVTVDQNTTIGLLDLPGGPSDQILVLSTDPGVINWTRIDPMMGTTFHGTAMPPARASGKIKRILRGGECGDNKPIDVLVVFENNIVAHYNAAGALISSESTARSDDQANFILSGCLSDQAGKLLRTYVHPSPIGGLKLEIDRGTGPGDSVAFLALQSGLAFSPLFAGERLLLGTQLVINDIVVTRGRLDTSGARLAFENVGSDQPPHIPYASAAADIDGDHRLDVISMLAESDAMPTKYSLWASLAVESGGRRIAGAFPITEDLCLPFVIAGDFDGDGVDDLIVAEATRLLCLDLGEPRAYFYPMGR
jgi:hypothetical protein